LLHHIVYVVQWFHCHELRTRFNHVHARSWTPTKVETLPLAFYCINLGECSMLWMKYHSKFYDKIHRNFTFINDGWIFFGLSSNSLDRVIGLSHSLARNQIAAKPYSFSSTLFRAMSHVMDETPF
jgi:hypothetical protein